VTPAMRILLLCLLPAALGAQGVSTGFEFLRLPYSARNAALGEAAIADNSDRLAAFLNPALLHGTPDFNVSISHQQWIQDVTSNLLQASLPLSFGSIGLTIASTTIADIEIRTVPGAPEGTFHARSALIGVTLAIPVQPDLAAGITVQHVYEKIYVDEATGSLVDAGLLYATPVEGLTAGLSLQHAGFAGRLHDRRPRLPVTLRGGLSHRLDAGDFAIRTMIAVSTEANQSGSRFHGGVEGLYAGIAAVRFGYQTGYAARGFSAGLGIHYASFIVDYGFVPFALGFGSGHLITIGILI